MAGHSKWSNIKHRKAAQDAKRGKIFTKLIRELTTAAREGGGDATTNPRLRAAVDKALSNNMTRDTIDRAVKRGSGELEGAELETVIYEGYGPAGTAVMVECMTDNRNRTVSEVRHAFSKNGGNLGTDGSVAYLFERKGQICYAPGVDEEALMDVALELDAEDIVSHDDGSVEVLTTFADFIRINEALIEAGFKGEEAEVTMLPTMTTELDLETAQKAMQLIEVLEDLDDVQNVYSNAEISEEILQQP